MSFKTSVHLASFEKSLNQLLPGDIVFTTEDHALSGAIRFLANLPISHCNLYSKPLHLIESSGTVCERHIPSFFENNNFIRAIAFQNPAINMDTRKKIVAAAESFKGKGYDAMQLLAHGVYSLSNNLNPTLQTIGSLAPSVPLAVKRMQTRVATPILDFMVGQENAPSVPGRPRQVMMCSTLIAYSYMDAGIDLKLTNAGYMGTDDLYNYCQRNMKKVFDVKFELDKFGSYVNKIYGR